MLHPLRSKGSELGVVDFVDQAKILLRREQNTLRRIVFHHDFSALLADFLKHFARKAAVEQRNGNCAAQCT